MRLAPHVFRLLPLPVHMHSSAWDLESSQPCGDGVGEKTALSARLTAKSWLSRLSHTQEVVGSIPTRRKSLLFFFFFSCRDLSSMPGCWRYQNSGNRTSRRGLFLIGGLETICGRTEAALERAASAQCQDLFQSEGWFRVMGLKAQHLQAATTAAAAPRSGPGPFAAPPLLHPPHPLLTLNQCTPPTTRNAARLSTPERKHDCRPRLYLRLRHRPRTHRTPASPTSSRMPTPRARENGLNQRLQVSVIGGGARPTAG